MKKYRLELGLDSLQTYRDGLVAGEELYERLGDERQSFKFYQAKKDFDAQLERQGVGINPEE